MSANVDEVGSANSTLQHVPMEKMNPSPRERRRSSISLAIPVCADQLAASVNIESHQVEFEAHGLKINRDGLFIEGANVSEIHQDDLRVLRELGRGACSVVMKAQHVQTRQLYAIKVFSVFDREKRAQLLKEVETLWGMECPSLIQFVGGYLKDGSIHIVLEYMDRGSLTDLIHDWHQIEYGEDLMAAITFQMLWGLGYLHFEHHVHRDVKPQNILLNSKGEVKLSDFGIARELEGATDLAQTMVGTIRYMSPERLAGTGYGVAADVWSVGVVLLEMAARRLPFDTTVSQIDLHDRLQQDFAVEDLIKVVPGYSPEFEEVLRGCLQPRHEERLSPEELLELEWFRQFRGPAGNGKELGEEVNGVVDSKEAAGAAGVKEVEGGDKAVGHAGEEDGIHDDTDLDGSEQHDIDRAAHVVRDFLAKVVECGPAAGNEAGRMGGSNSNGGGGQIGGGLCGRRESNGSGMIQTMYSDDETDSDQSEGEFGIGRDEDCGGFAGFSKEKEASQQRNRQQQHEQEQASNTTRDD